MYRRTDGQFGVNEALFASALAAMVFSIVGAQPLTIVGITGLISLFNYTIYDIVKIYDVSLYEGFMVWNVSSITAQAKQFPLKKPGGFHWDFFLLGLTTFISGILFIPFPNGLVPQAPVHTDSLTVYETHVKRISSAEGDYVEPKVIAESVVEQRVSHFVMGLAIIGTMTGPLLVVLHIMPRSIFAGVFFVVGWGSIESNGILKRLVWLVREPRFVQPRDPLLTIRRSRIGLYLFWQALGVLSTVAISQTIAAIGFPVLIIAMIPLRWKILPKMFTAQELTVLDALTADNEVVLASLGGKPEMPEHRNNNAYDKVEEGQLTEGIRQRVGNIH
ncbi:MAG: hypothetical protein Q9217_000941 [Psora testacea]